MAETLHVYGHVGSQPARSVLVFCRLSNIPFEYHQVNLMQRENYSEEFTSINPWQEVPAIVYGDFKLNESAAIVPYLADAFSIDNQWYPKNIQVRARINAYLHWHHQGVRGPCIQYLFEKIIAPVFINAPVLTEEREAVLKANLENFFSLFNSILSETHYAARTSTASIADVFAYNEIVGSLALGIDLSLYPEVRTWLGEIGAIEPVAEYTRASRELFSKIASSN